MACCIGDREDLMDKEQAREWVDGHRAFIAVAEACWKGSYSWHVLGWMSYRLRRKYPLFRKRDQLIDFNMIIT